MQGHDALIGGPRFNGRTVVDRRMPGTVHSPPEHYQLVLEEPVGEHRRIDHRRHIGEATIRNNAQLVRCHLSRPFLQASVEDIVQTIQVDVCILARSTRPPESTRTWRLRPLTRFRSVVPANAADAGRFD